MPRSLPPVLAGLSALAGNGWIAGAVALAAGTITGGVLWVGTYGVARLLPDRGGQTASADTNENSSRGAGADSSADDDSGRSPLSWLSGLLPGGNSGDSASQSDEDTSSDSTQSPSRSVRSANKRLLGTWAGKMERLLPMRVEFRRDGAMHVTEYGGGLGPLAGSAATTWVVYREAGGVYYLRNSINVEDHDPDRDLLVTFLDDDRIQLTLPIDSQLALLSGRSEPMVAVLEREGSPPADPIDLPKGAERIVGLWHGQLKERDDGPMPGRLQLDFRDDGTLAMGVSQPIPFSEAPVYDEQHRARWKFVKSSGNVLTLDISDPQSDNRSTWTITFQGNLKMTLQASDDPQSKTFTRVPTAVR
jgi:hypothetical protein